MVGHIEENGGPSNKGQVVNPDTQAGSLLVIEIHRMKTLRQELGSDYIDPSVTVPSDRSVAAKVLKSFLTRKMSQKKGFRSEYIANLQSDTFWNQRPHSLIPNAYENKSMSYLVDVDSLSGGSR